MKLIDRNRCPDAPLGQPDPYMLRAENGRYYLYATDGQVYRSERFDGGWEYLGIRLEAPKQHTIWAPCVIFLDGRYYMYYSSIDEGAVGHDTPTMRVAVADEPEGPFVCLHKLLPPFSIDPHAVKTPSGLYLFYSSNDETAERPGTHIYCDRLLSPTEAEGKPVCVVRPTLDEEIFRRDRFKPGQHWHTVEGAFWFWRDGMHYLMYSGACFQNPTYYIGWCTAEGAEDADLRTLPWQKYPDAATWNPLPNPEPHSEGMGHNSVLFEGDEAYIVFHARDLGDAVPGADTRSARIARLLIHGRELNVEPV